MQISERGVSLIKRFEGLRLEAYLDSVNVLTIGYGSTGGDVYPGMTITERQAEELLMRDISRFEIAVNRLVAVPINQNEFDSLVSFSFNLGAAALGDSTLLKKLNASDRSGAAQEFTRWTYAGGVELAGLVRRRQAERDLFIAPVEQQMPDSWLDEVVLVSDANIRPYDKS